MITEILFFQNLFTNVDTAELADFFLRLIVNIISVFILIRYIYYTNNGQLEYLYNYFLMALIVFLVASILDRVKIELGFALGLFAIFSIIRFRTPPIEMKEMTYLFTALGISVINALVEFKVANWFGMLIANLIILISAFIMEKYKPRKSVLKKMLTFNPSGIEVLNSDKNLMDEIKLITKIDVFKVDILKVNATKNEITLWIYYKH